MNERRIAWLEPGTRLLCHPHEKQKRVLGWDCNGNGSRDWIEMRWTHYAKIPRATVGLSSSGLVHPRMGRRLRETSRA